MRKITEQKCIEDLHKITGIPLQQILNYPFIVEEIEGFDGIHVDYEDIKATLFGRDIIMNATIKADSYQFALEQVNKIVNNLNSKNLALNISDGVLVYFTTNDNVEILKLIELMEIIHIATNRTITSNDINVIWGNRYDNVLKDDYIKIDLFASYKKEAFIYANNINF